MIPDPLQEIQGYPRSIAAPWEKKRNAQVATQLTAFATKTDMDIPLVTKLGIDVPWMTKIGINNTLSPAKMDIDPPESLDDLTELDAYLDNPQSDFDIVSFANSDQLDFDNQLLDELTTTQEECVVDICTPPMDTSDQTPVFETEPLMPSLDIENSLYNEEPIKIEGKNDMELYRYLKKDCFWTGCNEICVRTHTVPEPPEPLFCLTHPICFKLSECRHNYEHQGHYTSSEKVIIYYTDDGPGCIEPSTEVVVQPYTPASDHCYHQPMPENMPVAPVKSPVALDDNVDSESASESSDDEVDVVTITQPIKMVTFMVPPRRQPERIVQAAKNVRKAHLPRRKPATAAVLKQAASALKRTNLQRMRKKNKKRTQASSLDSSCNSDSSRCCDSDSEEIDKRVTHNKMERRRREDQKRELQNLRMCIPHLKDNIRASKVNILQEGKHYVEYLQSESKLIEVQRNNLNRLQLQLKRRLNRLRRELDLPELT